MRVVVRRDDRYGRTTVGKRRSSTGIYGRRVGGNAPNNAVRVRGRR